MMIDGYRLVDDADLATRNTFGIAARAPLLVEVDDAAALPRLFDSGVVDACDPALLVLGGGSNLLFAADPAGPVLTLTARNLEIDAGDGPGHGDGVVVVRASAGVPWHGFVMHTLSLGLRGLENLALIPGTVGAAPIQNIGAYGVEVRDRVHAVEVFERATGQVRRLGQEECRFAYRDSAFKREPQRWIVTAVEFALSRDGVPVLGYAGLRDELAATGIATPTAMQVAEAVIRIRRRKLPDPAVLGNAGSFFKNPIVTSTQAEALHAAHPALPVFGGGSDAVRKLSAAWLIDACGWKGHRDGDAGVSPEHALVLVNHGHATGAQLLALARDIATSVCARFDVELEPEPRIVGAQW
jgi:UDP-N-acetylmuramate dehydrogenase